MMTQNEIIEKARREAKERRDLRDQFAMAALTGMLAGAKSRLTFNEFARDAYIQAEAMLIARELSTDDLLAREVQSTNE